MKSEKPKKSKEQLNKPKKYTTKNKIKPKSGKRSNP